MKMSLVVLLVLAVFSLGVMAQDSEVRVELLEEEIVGLALYPDGKTPVADIPVRVWNVDKREMIYRSRTDANGSFKIPKLETGQNYLFVGRVRVNLKIFKGDANAAHQSHDIIMVVSRGMVVPAKPSIASASGMVIPASGVVIPAKASVASATIMDVLMAPVIINLPDDPPIVSP